MRREVTEKTLRQLNPEFPRVITRLFAFGIDTALIVGLLLPSVLLPLERVGVPVLALILLVVVIVTFVMTLTEFKFGRTPGKLVLGLRVVKIDGNPIDLKTSLVRNLMRIYDVVIDIKLEPLNGRRNWKLLGWALGIFRHRWWHHWPGPGQRWGDELAGTYVIRGQWKPVRIGSSAPASSKTGTPGEIRLSGRKPGK